MGIEQLQLYNSTAILRAVVWKFTSIFSRGLLDLLSKFLQDN